MAGYKLGERPYENILEKYNVTNPLALVLYDDIYKKGYSDGYAKAIDECIKIIEETVWKDTDMLVESIRELKGVRNE